MPYTWITLLCSLALSASVALLHSGNKLQDGISLCSEQICFLSASGDEAQDLPTSIRFDADLASIVADSEVPPQDGAYVIQKNAYLGPAPIRAPPATV